LLKVKIENKTKKKLDDDDDLDGMPPPGSPRP